MINLLYKICIIGDGGVGKTTILYQYVDGKFVEETRMTIGTNFFIKDIYLEEIEAKIKFQIWDLGGQEHFSAVRPGFYAGAMGLIYTYDLTRIPTFYNLQKWKEESENSLISNHIPSILVGNKLDLIGLNKIQIQPDEINDICSMINACEYFETSAKNGMGIDMAFKKLGSAIYHSKHKF